MLYLAEVKRQNRGFIGGFKTELKLLACLHNDQTWSAVPTEDLMVWEDSQMPLGDGTLLLVNLNTNRQIQGTPEFAGTELVRHLQKISRLMEKNKKEWEEIEQWKESLKIQAKELARREMELETQQEQIEQMEQEFEYLERQRNELEVAREKLKQEQDNLENTKSQFGLPAHLRPEQTALIEALINRLGSNSDSNNSPEQQLNLVLETIQQQQNQFTNYWQQLEQKRILIEQRQREIEQQRESLVHHQQELAAARVSLEEAKIQLQVQQTILANKQELLSRITLDLQTIEFLQSTLTHISTGREVGSSNSKINLQAIENMPLGELEENVKNFGSELDKLVRFVNEQEEELTLQSQTVDELKAQLQSASEFERLSIEEELKDEQERKKMLDKTLVGQRRTLWERQEILLQHLRVLRRRQGILEPEQQGTQINLTPLFNELENQQNNSELERQQIETEIEQIQYSIQQLKEIINQQISEQQNRERQLEQEQERWQQARVELTQLQSELAFYQEKLEPFKDSLTRISQNLQELMGWFNPSWVNNFH